MGGTLNLSTLTVLATAVAASAPVAASPDPAAAGPNTNQSEVRFSFEGGLTRITDDTGSVTLQITGRRSAVDSVPHGAGRAIRFTSDKTILESTPTVPLNPMHGDFSYGAAIKITPTDVRRGANVVQKGYAGDGKSQFKLQVDGGKPACVLVGADNAKIYRATATTSVADGRWHALDCARRGTSLRLTVDGSTRASVAVPTALSVDNPSPLIIAGRQASGDNDQFVGELDDVFVRVQERS